MKLLQSPSMMTRAAAVVVLDYLQRKGQLPPFFACRVDPSQLIFLVPAQIDPPRSSLTGIYQVQTLSLLTNGHCNRTLQMCRSTAGPCYALSLTASELLLKVLVHLSRDLQYAGTRFSVGAIHSLPCKDSNTSLLQRR